MYPCFPHSKSNPLSSISSWDDGMLVEAARSGENLAFSELWNRYAKKISRLVKRITRNQQDADDALQETFMKAYAHLKTFDGRSRFSTWLTRIAINSALMILRQNNSHFTVSIDGYEEGEGWGAWEIADQTMNAEERYSRHEREHHLKRAIKQLSPTLRTVVEIQQRHDTSVKEIAELAGLSVAATKSRLLRARKAMRRSLSEQYDPSISTPNGRFRKINILAASSFQAAAGAFAE